MKEFTAKFLNKENTGMFQQQNVLNSSNHNSLLSESEAGDSPTSKRP